MGALGTFAVQPFPKPRKVFDVNSPDAIRAELNTLAKNLTGHDADAALHTVSTTTTGVSGATAIYSAITGMAVAWVQGTDGAGKTFVDQVAWNGTTNIKGVVSSTTVDGAPAARTYTVVAGVLKLAMAAGTYTIVIVPIAFA